MTTWVDPRDGETWEVEISRERGTVSFRGDRGEFATESGDVTETEELPADKLAALLDMARSAQSPGINDDLSDD